jgi:hypothetical protein
MNKVALGKTSPIISLFLCRLLVHSLIIVVGITTSMQPKCQNHYKDKNIARSA